MTSPPFRTSQRMAAVQAPIISVIAELSRAHQGTISLGQGVVHYGPPEAARLALRGFSERPENHKYGNTQGLPALREQFARKLAVENGIDCSSGRSIVVSAGSNMAFLNALFAITDPGDEVILPLPYYFNHEMATRMVNCTPIGVPTDADFQLDLDAIRAAITERTRAIVTISPNNPSGAVYPETALRTVNALCAERGLYHISDEAYEYFVYAGAHHFSPASIAGAEAHTIALYSMSKAYGFASWRIGFSVLPDHLLEPVLKVQDTNLICAPLNSQQAAVGALGVGSAYCRDKLATFAHVRETVLTELAALGDLCDVPPAEGAFYVLIKVNTELDSLTLAERLIREHRVAVIPGSAFGLTAGCYLRIAYGALEPETVAAGIRRLTSGLLTITGH